MEQNSDLLVNYHRKSYYNGYRRGAGPMEEPDSSPRGAQLNRVLLRVRRGWSIEESR